MESLYGSKHRANGVHTNRCLSGTLPRCAVFFLVVVVIVVVIVVVVVVVVHGLDVGLVAALRVLKSL